MSATKPPIHHHPPSPITSKRNTPTRTSPLPRSPQQPQTNITPTKCRTNKQPFHIPSKLPFQPSNIQPQRKLSYANQQPIILNHQNSLRLLQRTSKESGDLDIMIIAI